MKTLNSPSSPIPWRTVPSGFAPSTLKIKLLNTYDCRGQCAAFLSKCSPSSHGEGPRGPVLGLHASGGLPYLCSAGQLSAFLFSNEAVFSLLGFEVIPYRPCSLRVQGLEDNRFLLRGY